MSRITVREPRRTISGLVVLTMEIRERDRTLHTHSHYIPPLESPLTAAECEQRAAIYAWAAKATLWQMFMSTTRGLQA